MVNFKIPQLLNAIHTVRNWGHFLCLTNNKCFINCPKTILSHLYTYIYIHLLDIEKYVRTIHSLLASKFGYWFSSFKALSLIHTIHIFMNGLLYLICYMIFFLSLLLDTEKYVRAHRRLLTPKKLLIFEGLWLLPTVLTDTNGWLFLSCELLVSHI